MSEHFASCTAILCVYYMSTAGGSTHGCRARRAQGARKKGWIRWRVFVDNVLQITSRECVARARARVFILNTKIVFIIHSRVSVRFLRTRTRGTHARLTLTESRADYGDAFEAALLRIFSYSLQNMRAMVEHVHRRPNLTPCVPVCIELIQFKLSCSSKQRQRNTKQ